MSKKFFIAAALLGAVAALGSGKAAQAEMMFSGTSTVAVNEPSGSLINVTAATPDPFSTGSINPGDVGTFTLGTIDFAGIGGNSVSIIEGFLEITLNFTSPAGVTASFTAIGTIFNNAGTEFDFFGLNVQSGPQLITFGDGGRAFVQLNNVPIFATGTGPKPLTGNITFVAAGGESPVIPEPTSLVVLGSGVLGMMGYGLRRRKQAV